MKLFSVLIATGVFVTATPAFSDDSASVVATARAYLNPYAKTYDPARGKSLLQDAAESGNTEAQYELGLLYDGKILLPAQGAALGIPDRARALSWYEKAADQDFPAAISSACSAHFYGADTTDNWGKTVIYCAKSLANKDIVGYAAMGEAYADGKGGLSVDGTLAVTYLTTAADAHEPRATEDLGHIYFDGKLVPQDYVRSAALFREALMQGRSAYFLAQQYEKGLGLVAEPLEAERLYYYSAQDGDVGSTAWIAAHPYVTAEHLTANSLSPLMIPPGVFTVTSKNVDGTTLTTEAMSNFWALFADKYPARAQDNEVEGTVELDCHWNATGWLDNCFVTKDAPAGYGFGRATLKAIRRPLHVDQQEKWNATFAGKSWHIVMKWVLS